MRRPHAPTPMPGLQCPGPPRVLRAPTSRAGPREALGLHLFSHFQPSLSPSSFLDPRASGSLTKPAPWPHWVWAALLSQLLCLGLSPLPWVSVSSLWVYLHPLGSDSDLTLSLVLVSISAPLCLSLAPGPSLRCPSLSVTVALGPSPGSVSSSHQAGAPAQTSALPSAHWAPPSAQTTPVVSTLAKVLFPEGS